jgi:hypothetical protein
MGVIMKIYWSNKEKIRLEKRKDLNRESGLVL